MSHPSSLLPVAPLPTGTLTFLFTDIEGSTQLWEQHPQAMPAALERHDAILIGFIGDEVVVNTERLLRSAAMLIGFARDLRERGVEKITISRGVTRDELRWFVFELAHSTSSSSCFESSRWKGPGVGKESGLALIVSRKPVRAKAPGVWS